MVPLDGGESGQNRSGFRRAHDWKWSVRLEAFWSTPKLGSARTELRDDSPGVRQSSRVATVVHEVESGRGSRDPRTELRSRQPAWIEPDKGCSWWFQLEEGR